MRNFILLIITLAIIGFFAYKYFGLDTNPDFQSAFKSRDIKSAETIVKNAVFETIQTKAKDYFYQHNNYFISKSNNVCVGIQSFFSGANKIFTNPIECNALEHTFTARIRSDITKTYYCADSTGFYPTLLDEPGFVQGVKCK